MKRRNLLLAACASLLMCAPSAFAQKPDFSGSWTLNADKSDFGMMPKPEKATRKIEHKDPELKYTSVQTTPNGERTNEVTYKLDGTESINKLGNTEVKSVAKWDGKNVVVDSKRDFQGTEITSKETWVLSEDGKTLNIDINVGTPQGDFTIKQVYEKQS